MTAFFITCFIGGSIVVAGVVLWPQRIPKGRSVDEIRARVESENTDTTVEHPLP